MSRLALCVCVCAALGCASVLSQSVFAPPPRAHMLLRSRRANSFLEELKPPDQERECVEESCDFEEAREIFQTREATLEFWTVYTDGNQCQSHMCVHGECVDLHQDYACRCHPGYEGRYCQHNVTATNCTLDNGGCAHDCEEGEDGRRRCGCVSGYLLANDGRSCQPRSSSSCGQLLIDRSEYSGPIDGLMPWLIGGEVGRKGESPWQVVLLNARGAFFCGGVLISESWVLTAAHCLKNNVRFKVRLGDYELTRAEGTEVTLGVLRSFVHPAYDSLAVDADIALLRLEAPAPPSRFVLPVCLPGRGLAERVLHRNGTVTVVTGWGRHAGGRVSSALNVIKVPLVERAACRRQMAPHTLSDGVLCAGVLGRSLDACQGDSGGPMVALYRDTWFLLGLVSWGEGCGRPDKLGVYTKVSSYQQWIRQVQDEWDRGLHRP
ncbi:LOW QUALITY PROTEIN: vitamin K-dependent protein C [Menidia menidia]